MTPEEFRDLEEKLAAARRRAKATPWNDLNDMYPIIKQRPSRTTAYQTFEQKLTDEDRAFLADLKVGL